MASASLMRACVKPYSARSFSAISLSVLCNSSSISDLMFALRPWHKQKNSIILLLFYHEARLGFCGNGAFFREYFALRGKFLFPIYLQADIFVLQ